VGDRRQSFGVVLLVDRPVEGAHFPADPAAGDAEIDLVDTGTGVITWRATQGTVTFLAYSGSPFHATISLHAVAMASNGGIVRIEGTIACNVATSS
jgi:hypothetical protein